MMDDVRKIQIRIFLKMKLKEILSFVWSASKLGLWIAVVCGMIAFTCWLGDTVGGVSLLIGLVLLLCLFFGTLWLKDNWDKAGYKAKTEIYYKAKAEIREQKMEEEDGKSNV